MVLSGSLSKSVGSHWKLVTEWTATQNISANTSTVTSKMYWQGLDSYSAISSSATKDGAQIIDGTTYTFSGSGLAGLSANQKKLINTTTKTITHNADGTKSFSIDGWFDAEVTLSGTYYGRVDLTSTSFTLNTIPRASTLTSSPSWTAGNDFTLNISRASSSFTHTANISVNGVLIKSITGIGTSASSGFSTANHTEIFNQINALDNQDTKIEIITYSGSSEIGRNTYTGWVTAPNASTTTSSASFNIGSPLTVNIDRANSTFTHTVRFILGSTTIHTETAIGTSVTWTPTSAEITSMYGTTPNSNSIASKIEIDTYYNGVERVRGTTTKTGTATVTNSNPTFGTGYNYSDTNAQTVSVTNNNTFIIQSKSTVVVTLPATAKAVAQNGATMVNYIATLNGVQRTADYSDTAELTFDFGTINSGVDVTLSIKCVDSRGNSTTTTKVVTMIPYSNPTVNATSTRENGFENTTILTMNGSYSLVSVNGVPKNAIQSVQYRYKDTAVETAPTWDTWSNFTYPLPTDGTYNATNVVLDLDNTLSFNIEFKIQDLFGDIVVPKTVSKGIPILFLSSDKKIVSVNQFPDPLGKALQVTGGIGVIGDITSDSTIIGKHLTANHTGGQYLSLNDSSYVAGTTGMYNYMGFNDGAGSYQAYLGFGSARDNRLNVYNKIGMVRVTSTTDDIELSAGTGKSVKMVNTILDMNNFGIKGVGDLHFNDIGSAEGVIWDSASGLNNWKMVVTDDGQTSTTGNDDNASLPFQWFRNNVRMMTLGTTGNLYLPTGDINMYGSALVKSVDGSITIESNSNATAPAILKAPMDYVYLEGRDGARVTQPGTTSTYKPILASAFTVNSYREDKTNIKEAEKGALEKVMATKVYNYHLWDEIEEIIGYEDGDSDKPKMKPKDPSQVKKRKGLISDSSPSEIVHGNGIDLYGMCSLLWSAVQELTEEVNQLKNQGNPNPVNPNNPNV